MQTVKPFISIHNEDSLDSCIDFSLYYGTDYHQLLNIPVPGITKKELKIYSIDNVLFFEKTAQESTNYIQTAGYQQQQSFRIIVKPGVTITAITLSMGLLTIGLIETNQKLTGVRHYTIYEQIL